MSSLVLKAKLSDNTTVDFSNRTLIKQRSIFNYPNKVFLMDKNYVFSVRYQVSNSDNSSYVRAFKIDTPLNCTQIEVQQYKSSYYVFVGCIRVPAYNLVSIFTYKFTQPQSGFLDQLVALPKIDVRFSLNCSKIILYSYDQLFTTYLSQSKVLLGCTTTTKSNQQSYMLNIYYFKSLQNVNASSIVNGNLTYCIRESNKIIEYQKGFLSFSSLSLNYYSYNPSSNTSTCTNNFLNTTGSKFVASVKDQDTHYIYVIY